MTAEQVFVITCIFMHFTGLMIGFAIGYFVGVL